MEKFQADLQMLEKTLITDKMKSAVQINILITDNFCFIISGDFLMKVQIRLQ